MTAGEAYLFNQRKLWEGSVGPSWTAFNRTAVKLLKTLHVLLDRGIDQAVLRETILVSCRDGRKKKKKAAEAQLHCDVLLRPTHTKTEKFPFTGEITDTWFSKYFGFTMAGWVTPTHTSCIHKRDFNKVRVSHTFESLRKVSVLHKPVKAAPMPNAAMTSLYKGGIQTNQQIHTPYNKHYSRVLLVQVFHLTIADKHPLAKHDKMA